MLILHHQKKKTGQQTLKRKTWTNCFTGISKKNTPITNPQPSPSSLSPTTGQAHGSKEPTKDRRPCWKPHSTWNFTTIKGADKGPQALLEASFNMEFYDIETDSEVFRRGIATLAPATEASSPEAMADEVERRMNAILDDKKFPVL